jgi:hypothetical protein
MFLAVLNQGQGLVIRLAAQTPVLENVRHLVVQLHHQQTATIQISQLPIALAEVLQ